MQSDSFTGPKMGITTRLILWPGLVVSVGLFLVAYVQTEGWRFVASGGVAVLVGLLAVGIAMNDMQQH